MASAATNRRQGDDLVNPATDGTCLMLHHRGSSYRTVTPITVVAGRAGLEEPRDDETFTRASANGGRFR